MAFGFIKKVFSFGKKEIEEKPVEGEEFGAQPAEPTPEIPPETPPQPEPGKPAEVPPSPAPPARPQEPTEPPSPEPEIPQPQEPVPSPPPGEPAVPQPEIPEPAPDLPEVPEPPQEIPQPAPEQPPSPAPEIPRPPQPSPPEIAAPEQTAPGSDEPVDLDETAAAAATVKEDSSPGAIALGADEERAGESEPLAQALREGRITVSKEVERDVEEAPAPAAEEPRKPWFQRLREGLSRSSRELRDNIAGVFLKRKLDEDTLQDLEDVLLRADLGLETAMRITDALAAGRYGKDVSGAEVQAVMAEEIEKVLRPVALPLELIFRISRM